MAKAKAKKKGITLQELAQEMNDVMEYGLNPDTNEIDEGDCINIDLDDDELLKVIKQRAEEDLQPNDEESFSPEAWDWFMNNGITPKDADDDDEENGAEDEEEEDDDDEEEAPPPKKKASKETTSSKKAAASKGEKKAAPGLLSGAAKSNPRVAYEIVEAGGDFDDCYKEFKKIYYKAGNKDDTYINQRSRIYYNMAVTELTKEGKIKGTFVGKPVHDKKQKDGAKEDAPKKSAAKAPQKASQKLAKKK